MMLHPSIRIGPLASDEVEEVLVSIWCALEKHNLESPHLTSRFFSGGKIGIEFTFKSPADAALVARVIDDFCPEAPLRANRITASDEFHRTAEIDRFLENTR